jgi:hypothetical protein
MKIKGILIVIWTIVACAYVHPAVGQSTAADNPAPAGKQPTLLEKLIGRSSTDPDHPSAELVHFLTRYERGPREKLVSGRYIPLPFFYLGPSIMPDGYRPLALRAETGLSMDARHILWKALAAFDNDRKDNDGTGPNPKGHDRYLAGEAYFRPAISGWSEMFFLGAGYRWSQLSTSNYTKSGSRWQPGGGYDWFHRRCAECLRSISARFEVNWILAGKDWQNGSHGPTWDMTIPSPREKRHLFFRVSTALLRYHDTVTDPNNPSLVRAERSSRHFTSFGDEGILYRF